MLLEIDRLQLAVPDMEFAANRWQSLLGAQVSSVDRVACLGANRTALRLGRGIVEILQPDGVGQVANAVAKRGPHMFSAGAACADVDELQNLLAAESGEHVREGSQLFIAGEDIGINGLRLVVSPYEERPAVGEIDYLYEATLLAADSVQQTKRFADVFRLDAQEFVTIESPRFGYSGTLTLFRKDQLHRFEVITPLDAGTTMGRFFSKIGPCLYMAFAETSDIRAIEQRVQAAGLGITVDRPVERSDEMAADQVWLHPATLGGVMLGLSRPSMAWQWSGHPERVEAL